MLATLNWTVNVAGGLQKHSSIVETVFVGETPSEVFADLTGRIALVRLGTSPFFTRESCRFKSSFTSYAFDGNGVKDDLAWIDKPWQVTTNNRIDDKVF